MQRCEWTVFPPFCVQIGEEMSQNSFIQQYLAKQQELLRQRLEREAQQDDADGITADTLQHNSDDTEHAVFL